MSVFSAFASFARGLPNPTHPSADATEMTQIVNLEGYIHSLDARLPLHSPTATTADDDDDDSSSLSSESVHSLMHQTRYKPAPAEDDDTIHNHAGYRDDDDVNQRLVPGDLENGRDDESVDSLHKEKRKNYNWVCIGFIAIFLLGLFIWFGSMAAIGRDALSSETANTTQHINFYDLYNSSFTPRRPTLEWLQNDPRDGVFTFRDRTTGDILLESIDDSKTEVLVKSEDLRIGTGLLRVSSFEISADGEYLMLRTNTSQQFRHSSHANVYIYTIKSKALFPLSKQSTVDTEPQISYATWSPTGHQVAFVMNNDLYVSDLLSVQRVTYDGSATVFNGVPDWVYEEEVFGTDFALWWSPDSTHVAYLRFNETAVPEYHIPFYTTNPNSTYPEEVSIKYPKAGSPNPIVSLHVHSLLDKTSVMVTQNATAETKLQAVDAHKDFDDEDRIITDVAWVTTTHTHLLFKQMNRIQDHEITNLVTIGATLNASTVQVARRYEPTDGGWIDTAQAMKYVPQGDNDKVHYIDIADDGHGYMHLAIFSANDRKQAPVWLTKGEYEVDWSSVVLDTERQLVHYISTERSPLERHLYSVSLKSTDPASTKVCRTCPESEEEHGYYAATFSPKAGYYVLYYEGPDVPTTTVRKVDNATFSSVLEDNQSLKKLLDGYDMPRSHMVTVQSGGVEMNAIEILPPNFDVHQKYPVVFNVYGGPGSQLVSYQFDLSWHTFLASKLEYIVVIVDGRGTGFRGRDYRVGVRGRLGELEVIDQVNAGRHWQELDYVDSSRMAIWGWSYGGYMTSKVLEANDGVFSVGLAVAPVTDWRFYDSIYTERYMSTPQLNPHGYETSAVNNMTGFENVKYLLAHGTGDDNVHFQNSAVLVDKLTQANIHSYRTQFYPDSNHRIQHHNANPNIYYLLTEFLWESFGGREYLHVRKEMHGRFSGPLETH